MVVMVVCMALRVMAVRSVVSMRSLAAVMSMGRLMAVASRMVMPVSMMICVASAGLGTPQCSAEAISSRRPRMSRYPMVRAMSAPQAGRMRVERCR